MEKRKKGYVTLNDIGFDKSPIFQEISGEDYQVDEEALKKSIEKNRELLIGHGHGKLFELKQVL